MKHTELSEKEAIFWYMLFIDRGHRKYVWREEWFNAFFQDVFIWKISVYVISTWAHGNCAWSKVKGETTVYCFFWLLWEGGQPFDPYFIWTISMSSAANPNKDFVSGLLSYFYLKYTNHCSLSDITNQKKLAI